MKNAENKKGRRKRRLHIIFFIDSHRTKSLTLGLSNFWLGVASFGIFFGLAIFSVSKTFELQKQLAFQNEHVLQLKSSIFAEGVVGHDILDSNFAKDSTKNNDVFEAIELAAKDLGHQTVDKSAQNEKAAIVVSTAVPTEPTFQPPQPTKTVEAIKNIEKEDAVALSAKAEPTQTKTEVPVPKAAPELPFLFDGFDLSEDEPGSTLIEFSLVNNNQKPRRGPITGWVCAAVEVETTEGLVTRPAPASVNMPTTPGAQVRSCRGGEMVKFVRLRPTELVVAASEKNIRRVVLYFSESSSGRVYSQSFAVGSISE